MLLYGVHLMKNGWLTPGDFVGFLLYMESLWWGIDVSKKPLHHLSVSRILVKTYYFLR